MIRISVEYPACYRR